MRRFIASSTVPCVMEILEMVVRPACGEVSNSCGDVDMSFWDSEIAHGLKAHCHLKHPKRMP